MCFDGSTQQSFTVGGLKLTICEPHELELPVLEEECLAIVAIQGKGVDYMSKDILKGRCMCLLKSLVQYSLKQSRTCL